MGLLCAIGATVVVFKEDPVPRGCGCISTCATAQSGCHTCPGVPWFLAISGGLGLIGGLMGLAWIAEEDPDSDTEEALMWVFIIGEIIYCFLEMLAGSIWRHRFSKQHGFLCCL